MRFHAPAATVAVVATVIGHNDVAESFETSFTPSASVRGRGFIQAPQAMPIHRSTLLPPCGSLNRFASDSRLTKMFAVGGGGKADGTNSSPQADRTLGVLVLLTVPMAWGTFEPAVRYVYAIEPPVPGFVFSVAYYLVAALSLSFLVMLSALKRDAGEPGKQLNEGPPFESGPLSLPIRGGAELGFYLFLGNGLQVLGLKTVPSDRAAFLLQLTTIFVPLVQAVIAKDLFAIRARTWGACFVALLGVAVIGLDSQSGRIQDGSLLSSFLSSFDSLTPGDFLIVLAAFSYTFHCIRLGVFAKETSALKLAACKAATETLLSLTLVLTLVAAGQHESSIDGLTSYASREGSDITKFLSSFAENVSSGTLPSATLLPAAGAVLWTGLVTVAYTIYAQSFGQSRVNPTDANLIYTIQPLFTALVAWALLGETLGPAGYVGGALIGSAVYLVAIDDSSNDSGEKFEPIEDSADETESLVEPELKSGT